MYTILSDVSNATASIEQINTSGMSPEIAATVIAVILGFISFVVSAFKFYRGIDKRIDERIDDRIKPSINILQETVVVVRSLEHTVAEMNATLNILKELLLTHGDRK